MHLLCIASPTSPLNKFAELNTCHHKQPQVPILPQVQKPGLPSICYYARLGKNVYLSVVEIKIRKMAISDVDMEQHYQTPHRFVLDLFRHNSILVPFPSPIYEYCTTRPSRKINQELHVLQNSFFSMREAMEFTRRRAFDQFLPLTVRKGT